MQAQDKSVNHVTSCQSAVNLEKSPVTTAQSASGVDQGTSVGHLKKERLHVPYQDSTHWEGQLSVWIAPKVTPVPIVALFHNPVPQESMQTE